MAGPATYPMAAVMALTAVYCAGRLVVAPFAHRASDRGADLLHVVMGAVMAAMLLGVLGRRWDLVVVVGFSASALWYVRAGVLRMRAASGTASRHSFQHGTGCLAMVAMATAGSSYTASAPPASGGLGRMAGMAGMGGVGAPLGSAALVPTVVVVGLGLTAMALAVPDLVLSRSDAGPKVAAAGRPALAPRCAATCRVAMSLTMGLALLTML